MISFSPREAYTHTHTYTHSGRIQLDLFQVKDRTDRCWWKNKRGEISGRKEKQQKGSSKFGELGENRWPSAPMGGLAFRTRNSPSQKTSLRWGDCCPPNPNPPSSSAVWKDRHQDMPPVPVWGCPPLLRDCTPRGLQRYCSFILAIQARNALVSFPSFSFLFLFSFSLSLSLPRRFYNYACLVAISFTCCYVAGPLPFSSIKEFVRDFNPRLDRMCI